MMMCSVSIALNFSAVICCKTPSEFNFCNNSFSGVSRTNLLGPKGKLILPIKDTQQNKLLPDW